MHKDSYNVLPLMREGLYLLYNYYLWSDFGLKKNTNSRQNCPFFMSRNLVFSLAKVSARPRQKIVLVSARFRDPLESLVHRFMGAKAHRNTEL